MKVTTFIIEGRKPLKVVRLSGGFSWRPSYHIIVDHKMINPTAYQKKKIYNYIKTKGGF